jgi:hypothetical protein
VPTVAKRPSTRGTRRSVPSAASAASAAALASSVSRARVTTDCGSTTPEVSGSSGRATVLISDVGLLSVMGVPVRPGVAAIT